MEGGWQGLKPATRKAPAGLPGAAVIWTGRARRAGWRPRAGRQRNRSSALLGPRKAQPTPSVHQAGAGGSVRRPPRRIGSQHAQETALPAQRAIQLVHPHAYWPEPGLDASH